MKTNKLYKSLLFISILTIFSISLSAQEAEFLKLNKSYTLHQDGSQEFRCYKELKLFTHTAMNSTYGETFIVYNPDFQELEIHDCYTKQKDGTIIKTPENAFVEVLPRFAANAPAYNQLKEMVVVHTGLDLGSTIYLDYSIRTKAGYYPELDIDELLQETSPILNYQISIAVPEDKTLNYLLYSSASKVNESNKNKMKVYSWQLSNIPASSRMPYLPQNKENIPRLTANTFRNGTDAFDFMANRINESIAIESETYAQFITEEIPSSEEKLTTIHNYVVNNLSTIAIPLDYTGYNLRNADETIRSSYGTVLEKTNLLNKMLNAVEIPSEIVFYYPSTISSANKGLTAIKQIGVKIKLNNREQFLSATSLSPIKPEYRGSLDKVFTLKGKEIPIETTPAIFDDTVDTSIDKSLVKNGYLVYTLPPTKGFDRWHISNLNSKRTDLFEIPSAIQDKITYCVKVPEGMELISSSDPSSITTSIGKVERLIKQEGDHLEIIKTIELKKQQYSPNEYSDLKKLIDEWNSNKSNELLFKVSK
ncbi:DUF3857 domain-containing protein [Massilibacteroides sp.]|uniref:DUF3857 domain-containing protein n=1 Tax=Massilibacteroides sp. TaxID=2034766 RepID=UPI0026108D21|nr:DUF3857 domain-containing protein [Massilibacteroides sp.]MDD4516525.1 DUF3857 domain-containing protein [Massilibacteroides sp.]